MVRLASLSALVALGGFAACSLANAPGDPEPATPQGTGGSGATSQGGGGTGAHDCGPVNTLLDCGACGVPCAPANAIGADCSSGSCDYAACIAPAEDCDGIAANGCESDPGTDPAHCGACINDCAVLAPNVEQPLCNAGTCDYTVCAPLFESCDGVRSNGCERPINTPADCGGCGLPCSPENTVGADCSSGSCGHLGCQLDWQDCDGLPENGCESYRLSDNQHCGACNIPCVGAESCVSGTCQTALDPQCQAAVFLFTGSDRNMNAASAGNWCDQGAGAAPEWQGAGWYRFTGAAGTQMPEGPPPEFACSTDAPGWLSGGHPTVAEGQAARTVCFNWSGNACLWSSPVTVLNCASFYLYYLPDAPVCNLRYCGT
ncbi:MAG: hypothetical protein IT373_37995 [Polyangiaceae bacterium]|nr:hypothetical protein [Polyangiaceae bacterium]